MKLSIGAKLIVGFLLAISLTAALWIYALNLGQKSLENSVGRSSVFLAESTLKRIDHSIYRRVEELQLHTKHLMLQEAIMESNRRFDNLRDIEAYINKKDLEWRAEPKDGITPFMQELMEKWISKELKKDFIDFYERKYSYKVFAELIATNKYGANVAQTGMTSDYKQSDENWWQLAKERGFYVGNVEYDESAATHRIPIALRIDDEGGAFLGIMKVVVALKGLIREAEIAGKKYETTAIRLLTKEGRLIYGTKAFKFLEDQSGKDFFTKIKGEKGFYILKEGGRERLYSYSRSKGYRNFEGLGWILLVGHDEAEILRPAHALRNNMIAASLVLVGLGLMIAFAISRSITVPIGKLIKGAERISTGDLEHRVTVKTKDEIGKLGLAFNQMAEKRKSAEEARDEKEEELTKAATYIDAMGDALMVMNSQMQFIQFNRAARGLLGYEEEEVPDLTFDKIFPEEERDRHFEEMNIGIDSGTIRNFETLVVTKNGKKIPVLFSGSTLKDAKGQLIGFVGVFKNIIKRKKMEEALLEYQIAVDGSEDIIAGVDREYIYRVVNKAFLKRLNLNRDQVIGHHAEEILGREIFGETIKPKLDTCFNGDPVCYETIHDSPESGHRNVEVHYFPVTSADGEIVRVVTIMRDITERKKAEDEISRHALKLKATNKELEAFTYSVSHDLRAPLRAIDGFSRILIEDHGHRLDEEGKRVLNIVIDNVRKMATLIDDLLAFSRIDKKAIEASRTNIADLATEVIEEVKLGFRDNEVTLDIDPLPHAQGDKGLLREVLINLFGNAIKYSKKGAPVSIQLSGKAENNENVYCVKDNGIGFDMKYADGIFGVFHRLHGSNEYEGTGIGLALVQRIIHRHGGRVWAEGNLNEGATFYFSLPGRESGT